MRILHVEDSPLDAELTRVQLEGELPGTVVVAVTNQSDYVRELKKGGFDLVLSDFGLVEFDGFEALALAQQHAPGVPFVFLSGTIGEELAIEIMRVGAQDYILKDRPWRLAAAIRRAVDEAAERQQRQAAEQAHGRLVAMLENTPDFVAMAAPDEQLQYVNRAGRQLIGLPAEAPLPPRMFSDLFMPKSASTLRRDLLPRLLRDGTWVGELALRGPEGQSIPVSGVLLAHRRSDGSIEYISSMLRDLTAQKILEEKFLRAQRLESIGMLATGIAHDLNNVLAPVLLGVTMLRERGLDEDVMKVLGSLERSAERGAALVRQILGFAHGIGGEQRVFEIRHLLRDVAGVARETFPRNIRVEQEVERHLWPILANPTQVHQVLLNLVVNARDAMPDGGTLSLRAENRVVDEAVAAGIPGSRPGSFLVVHVSDTGTGIAPDVLARMWEPFFTTKEAGKGTGLGLPTVRGIVEDHGGFIHIETTPGRGTAFNIYFPAAEDAAELDEPTDPVAVPRGNNELILLVDDEAHVRDLATSILTHHGYRVLAARDGVEAVAQFAPRSDEIRVIVTDLQMPNLDGAALAAVIRRLNPQAKLIAASGMSGVTAAQGHPLARMADAFLPKPFRADALLGSVHRLLHPEANGKL
jgi:two-component system, cell cycle sensor histidine kinase and response regulator CckA